MKPDRRRRIDGAGSAGESRTGAAVMVLLVERGGGGDVIRARPPPARRSAAQLAPGGRPVGIRHALHVGTAVQTRALRRGPEPDLLEVGLVLRVEGVAVCLVGGQRTRLAIGRRLAEP